MEYAYPPKPFKCIAFAQIGCLNHFNTILLYQMLHAKANSSVPNIPYFIGRIYKLRDMEHNLQESEYIYLHELNKYIFDTIQHNIKISIAWMYWQVVESFVFNCTTPIPSSPRWSVWPLMAVFILSSHQCLSGAKFAPYLIDPGYIFTHFQ